MSQTQTNLSAAFAGESQANRKYLAFAKQADAEKLPQVAKLFRAAAEAETLHANTHMRNLGMIKSTAENLKSAIEGETKETKNDGTSKSGETEAQKRLRLQAEATKLVRIRVTCMNPAKKEWEGEIFTSGNANVGSISKYVPFNSDDGWHVPRILLNMIKERQCQIFVSKKDSRGNMTRTGKLIKEFAVEILDPLTTEELAELAARQAATKAID